MLEDYGFEVDLYQGDAITDSKVMLTTADVAQLLGLHILTP